jgi:Gluconate 2-dehydrogenase subunit 3
MADDLTPKPAAADRDGAADLTRRQLLEVAAGAVVATQLLAAAPAAVSAAGAEAAGVVPGFFTAAELKLVDELTEMIIPTDEHSPGARDAKVAAYIDARLAEAFDKGVRTRWRAGLQAIDAAAKAAHNHAFMQCTSDERLAILTKIAEGERNPQTPVERFFVELKQTTVKGYYSSEIGIHKEMEYKGNTLQEEYSGIDVSK